MKKHKQKQYINEFHLGDKVKDYATEMKGTVVARIHYLTGCVRYACVNKKGYTFLIDRGAVLRQVSIPVRTMSFEFDLGQVVRVVVSPDKQMVISRAEVFIGGYNRYECKQFEAKEVKDLKDGITFEEAELEAVCDDAGNKVYRHKTVRVVERAKEIMPSPEGEFTAQDYQYER